MRQRLLHLPMLAIVLLGLTAGLWVALIRIGWSLPGGGALVGLHGPLMIAGVSQASPTWPGTRACG